MSRSVYIFINGILSRPGSADGWTDRAVTWTNLHTEACGEKYEYLAGALTRRFFQNRRAQKLAKMILFYSAAEWAINLVGHSNGCDVILRALEFIYPRPPAQVWPIKSLHLLSPACEADFHANGLNDRLWNKEIGAVHVYVAGADRAMVLGSWTRGLLGWMGLGYGVLGRFGPKNANARGIETHVEPTYGHSTWFDWGNFDETLHRVTEKADTSKNPAPARREQIDA